MNGGKLVVELLKEQRVKHIFGVPGGQTLYVNNALIDSGIEFVQTRHEGGAAAAADAYGRTTGTPGVCLATTGPGATNLITGLGGALRDSSPVIALIFQNRTPDAGKGDAQEADHAAIFSSITKAYIPVPHICKLEWAMREAYRIALTGRPGPVVVDLYRDVVEEQDAEYTYVEPEKYCVKANNVPVKTEIDKCAEMLAAGGKVAILSGNGVKYSNAGEEVLRLSEILNAPIVTTFNGISGVSNQEENVFGARSRHGSAFTKSILVNADIVLVLGSNLSAISTNRWSLPLRKVMQIDLNAQIIGRHYPVELGLVGDINNTLSAINDALSGMNIDNGKRDEWMAEIRQDQEKWLEKIKEKSVAKAVPASPFAVMAELSKLLKEDGILCIDAGNPGAWSHLLTIKKGVKYIKPVNYGNMGFALPAGIAAKMAYPEKEVITIVGDGSLGMTLADLETAARIKKNLIIILMNDQAFGNIKQEELYKFGDGRYNGVEFTDVDYVEVARGLGCNAVKIDCADQLAAAMESARKLEDKPTLIDLHIDGGISVWPEAF